MHVFCEVYTPYCVSDKFTLAAWDSRMLSSTKNSFTRYKNPGLSEELSAAV